MIARGFRLRKATDFSKTYKFGKSYNHSSLYIKALPSKSPVSRFAVVVPKKVSKKAVERNRARRRIYEIIRLNLSRIDTGYTIIITAKSNLEDLNPKQLETILLTGLNSLKIVGSNN